MENIIKFITIIVFLSLLQTCYTSRPRPDIGRVIFSFGSDEHEFRRKEHEFRQNLTTAHIHVERSTADFIADTWINIYIMNISSIAKAATLASRLGISKISVIGPQLSVVTVRLALPSDEQDFLRKLEEADIHVLWEYKQPNKYPRDQDYSVEASLQSEVEEIAMDLGILKRKRSKPKYVSVQFTLGLDKVAFMKKLKKEGINLKNKNRRYLNQVREYLVEENHIPYMKAIAQMLNILDIVYDMTPLSPVSIAFIFRSDEYEFHQKLDEANISFEVNERDIWAHPKINEYFVKTSLIPQVQEIATALGLDVS